LGFGVWDLETSQPAGKPNSVENDHSSRPAIARGLRRPTRWLRTGRPVTPPYLVLLRAGFCLPSELPRTRCALTAPFHPYPTSPLRATSRQAPFRACLAEAREACEGWRYIFCATIRQVALPGRYPAHCPMEFGLSSRRCLISLWRASFLQPARRSAEARRRAIV